MDRPHQYRAMALLLGGWLVGTILVGFVAAENFWIVDRLLATSLSAGFHKDVSALPAGEARAMLRYLVSEQNRLYFVWWGWAEVMLGIATLILAAIVKDVRLIAGFTAMLVISLAMQLYLTPRMVVVGRALDFVPREPAPPGLSTFGMLHAAYSTLDLIKLAAGIWLVWLLLRLPSESRPQGRGQEVGSTSP